MITQEIPIIVDSYLLVNYSTFMSRSPRPIVMQLDNNTFPDNDTGSQYTEVTEKIDLNTVAPRYNEQHLKAWQNYSKICGDNPRYNKLILTVPTHNLPCYNEYFVLSLLVIPL